MYKQVEEGRSTSDAVVAVVSPTSGKPRARQRPACEECRRRKLRCDGKKPRCSTCEHAGTECDINTNRVPRGPKKGYLIALQSKIATLESRLQAQEQVQFRWSDSCSLDNDEDMFTMTASLPTSDMVKGDSARSLADMSSTSIEVESDSLFNTFFDADSVSTTTMSLLSDHTAASSISSESIQRPTRFYITNMMQAELDQLYFDRMHAAVPILHQRNYLSWSKSIVKTKLRMCLQYAVWATASLMSVQFQHLQDTIYPELKRALASIHLPSHPRRGFLELDVELVQAWILTATFEFVKTYHHEACISAGRAFRLVQLMGLHEMDLPSNFDRSSSASNGSDFIILEEKRRAFWMAFTLEALYSMRNNLPLVVNEHMISTHLPLPDHEFQNGQAIQTGLLGDWITKRSQAIKSPLNECIMLVAMCARTTFYAQQYSKQHSCLYSHAGCDRFEWQQWLDNVLLLRLQTLAQDYPSPTNSSDPTLLFANFLAQAAIVYLWREIRNMEWPNKGGSGGGIGGIPSLVAEYQQRALTAVTQIVDLARSLLDFPFFKIHPFMTMPLALAVDFLIQNQSDNMAASLLHDLLNTLRQLKNINNSHESYVDLLDLNQLVTGVNM